MADDDKAPAVPDRASLKRIYSAVQRVERSPVFSPAQVRRGAVEDPPRLAKSTDTITAASGDTCGFGHAAFYNYDLETEGSRDLVLMEDGPIIDVYNPWPRAISSNKRLIIKVISGRWTLMEADCS